MTAETTEWRCPDTGRLCTPEDCDRVCFQSPAEAHGSERDAQEQPFEDWWEREGQFGRAGGGQYEKTFAWNAWCAASKAQPKGMPDVCTCPSGDGSLRWPCPLHPAAATAPAPAPATGDTNGRRDGLRSAVHGRVAVGGYTPGALADLLWASPDVMSLNAELGLSMDQLVQLTQAVLTTVPCAAVGAEPVRYPHPDEDDPVTLWKEIRRLRAAMSQAKCDCTAYCGQYVLHGHCQAHPAKVAVVSFAPATVRGVPGAELSDEQINKIISQHEVHEYHPGATLEFARAVIAADRATR